MSYSFSLGRTQVNLILLSFASRFKSCLQNYKVSFIIPHFSSLFSFQTIILSIIPSNYTVPDIIEPSFALFLSPFTYISSKKNSSLTIQ